MPWRHGARQAAGPFAQMADAAFAVASVAVSCFVPAPRAAAAEGVGGSGWRSVVESNTCTLRRPNEIPLRISLLISLLLLSLGILEALPSSLLIFLDNHAQKQKQDAVLEATEARATRVALSMAYRVLLWADCVYIAAVVPAAVCSIVLLRRLTPRGSKEDKGQRPPHSHGNTRVGGSIIRVLCIVQSFVRFTVNIIKILCGFLVKQIKFSIGRGRHQNQRTLPLVRSDQSLGQLNSDTMATGSAVSCSGGEAKVTGAHRYFKPALFGGSIVGLSCSFLSFRALGRFVTEIDNEMEETIALKTLVSQICALGVLISSVLGAFGSVSMPYTCLMGFYLPHISDHSIKASEKELQSVMLSLEEVRLRGKVSTVAGSGSDAGSCLPSPAATSTSASRRRGFSFFRKRCGSLSRACSSSGIHADDYQAVALRDEIDYLQNLHHDITEELVEMRQIQLQTKRSRTPIGQLMRCFGVIFSGVLLIRIGTAVLAVMIPAAEAGNARERSDPITKLLSILIGFSVIDEVEYNSLQQLSSLLLSAFLSFSQVNMFLKTMTALNRRVGWLWMSCWNDFVGRDQNNMLNASITSWLLSGIMGSFFLCCLVLTKMNMPRDYRTSFSAALQGSGDFSFDATRTTNSVFAFSCIVSAAVLGSLFGIRRKTLGLHLADTSTPRSLGTKMHVHADV